MRERSFLQRSHSIEFKRCCCCFCWWWLWWWWRRFVQPMPRMKITKTNYLLFFSQSLCNRKQCKGWTVTNNNNTYSMRWSFLIHMAFVAWHVASRWDQNRWSTENLMQNDNLLIYAYRQEMFVHRFSDMQKKSQQQHHYHHHHHHTEP